MFLQGRKGRVLHTHQSFFAFLHNRDITENGGVFVTRCRSLASLAPKSNVLMKPGADLSKMNPALAAPSGGMVGSGAMGRGPRDRHIGLTVTVVKGPHKGYVGTIKDTNGQIARVELRTGNKLIMIDKEKLYRRLYAFPRLLCDSFCSPRNADLMASWNRWMDVALVNPMAEQPIHIQDQTPPVQVVLSMPTHGMLVARQIHTQMAAEAEGRRPRGMYLAGHLILT